MRVITGDCSPETATTVIMPRAFLVKKTNYSNCPLKKRPVNLMDFEDDQSDNSEPENLSTKPEDLRINAQPKREPQAASTPKASPSSPFGSKLPLEPLDLNALKSELPGNYQAPAPTWVYPPHGSYVPFPGYQYPSPAELFAGAHHPHYPATGPIYPLEAYHDRERSATASPPQHVGFSAACLPHPARPAANPTVAVIAPHHGGLSPTSSTSSMFQRYSPPPATPEDLSSPGSVASSGSLGSAGTGKGPLGVAGIKKPRSDVSPRYECPDCAKSYSTFSGLSKHRQFHCVNSETSSAQKSFSCKFCDKTYVSLGALKMHIRTHTLPCKCPMCNKAFSRPWLLQGHIRTHTGEKPFSCQHCNRAFADRSNLRAHLQTHAEVKKYNCPVCSKTFSRMSLLNKHAESGCR